MPDPTERRRLQVCGLKSICILPLNWQQLVRSATEENAFKDCLRALITMYCMTSN